MYVLKKILSQDHLCTSSILIKDRKFLFACIHRHIQSNVFVKNPNSGSLLYLVESWVRIDLIFGAFIELFFWKLPIQNHLCTSSILIKDRKFFTENPALLLLFLFICIHSTNKRKRADRGWQRTLIKRDGRELGCNYIVSDITFFFLFQHTNMQSTSCYIMSRK